jgi:hypothetical protein
MSETESVEDPNVRADRETNNNTVSLHIERLVLDGFPVAPGSTMQIQVAVQNELTRLLTQNGLRHAGYALQSTTAPGFQVVGNPAPMELGRNIARSIFESLKRST